MPISKEALSAFRKETEPFKDLESINLGRSPGFILKFNHLTALQLINHVNNLRDKGILCTPMGGRAIAGIILHDKKYYTEHQTPIHNTQELALLDIKNNNDAYLSIGFPVEGIDTVIIHDKKRKKVDLGCAGIVVAQRGIERLEKDNKGTWHKGGLTFVEKITDSAENKLLAANAPDPHTVAEHTGIFEAKGPFEAKGRCYHSLSRADLDHQQPVYQDLPTLPYYATAPMSLKTREDKFQHTLFNFDVRDSTTDMLSDEWNTTTHKIYYSLRTELEEHLITYADALIDEAPTSESTTAYITNEARAIPLIVTLLTALQAKYGIRVRCTYLDLQQRTTEPHRMEIALQSAFGERKPREVIWTSHPPLPHEWQTLDIDEPSNALETSMNGHQRRGRHA